MNVEQLERTASDQEAQNDGEWFVMDYIMRTAILLRWIVQSAEGLLRKNFLEYQRWAQKRMKTVQRNHEKSCINGMDFYWKQQHNWQAKYGHIVINKAQNGNNNTFFFPSQLADSKNHWIEQITNMDVE